jgi:hypothetical protein
LIEGRFAKKSSFYHHNTPPTPQKRGETIMAKKKDVNVNPADTNATTAPASAPETAPAGANISAYPSAWTERVGVFAANVGKSLEEVTDALAAVVGSPSDQAVEILADADSSPDNDLKDALSVLKIPSGVFRKNLAILRGPVKQVTEAAVGRTSSVLPSIPADVPTFLESLKIGGILKPGENDVAAAASAGFASRLNIYELPTILLNKMKQFAKEQEEPCGKQYYALRKLITRRNNAELLAALDLDSNAVSATDRKEFLERLDSLFWPGLFSFSQVLKDVYEAYMQLLNNQSGLAIASVLQNAKPVQTVILRTDGLRDAAEAFINRANRVFSDVGIPAGRTLAWEYGRIKEILEMPEMPTAIGATNKEQMLKLLGINVEADVARMEQDLVQFAVAIMHLPKVPRAEEVEYVQDMYMLSACIPWDKLAVTAASSGPARRPEPFRT